MQLTPKKINLFILFKLPLGYLSGMRVQSITQTNSVVKITHNWINQNPFKSMFWAAQGMAAELSTGVLIMQAIKQTNKKVSMLVIHQEANFYKKATGTILFICADGKKIKKAIETAIQTEEVQLITLTAEGKNNAGTVVSAFSFQWSLKVKL